MTPFRLAHLSDPHLPPPEGALAVRPRLKQRLSRLAWRGKSHTHQPAILDLLVADIQAHRPDHIAVTGDLTNFSAVDEMEAARRWLDALAPPADLTVSPGNHDALVAMGAGRWDAWRPWLGDDADEDSFPQLRRRGDVAIINLCSALPTPVYLAQGRLGAAQIEKLDAILDQTSRDGLYRALLIHHPPTRGIVSQRKSLVDARAFSAVLARHGADIVLHGHAHEAAVSTLKGPAGAIPVLGVPSASANGLRHARARWHELEIARADGGFTTRVTARGVGADGVTVSELGRYVLTSAQRR